MQLLGSLGLVLSGVLKYVRLFVLTKFGNIRAWWYMFVTIHVLKMFDTIRFSVDIVLTYVEMNKCYYIHIQVGV